MLSRFAINFVMKAILFSTTALRQWTRLGTEVRARIEARLERYAENGHGDVKKLRGRAGLRIRVGDWRDISFEDRDTITVVAVAHWRQIYD